MQNDANLRHYHWLSSIYDLTVKNSWFERARRREFDPARIQHDDDVLIVGVGTGLDIPYLPETARVIGTDISSDMLAEARSGRASSYSGFVRAIRNRWSIWSSI